MIVKDRGNNIIRVLAPKAGAATDFNNQDSTSLRQGHRTAVSPRRFIGDLNSDVVYTTLPVSICRGVTVGGNPAPSWRIGLSSGA